MTKRLVVVVALAACGGSNPGPSGPSSWSAPSIAAQVPADTPYLMGSFEPVGEKLRRRMLAGVEQQLESALEQTRELAKEERGALAPWLRAGLAVLDEIRDKPATEWNQALGFARDPRWVVYGLGVWPVARVEVADAQRLRGVITRGLAAGKLDVHEQSSGGRAYWRVPLGKIEIVAAVLDHEMVAALLPAHAIDAALPNLLGTAAPGQSLATSGTVPELMARYHVVKSTLGYIDARALVNVLTRAPTELDALVRDTTGPVTAACKGDLERLSANLPRVVYGYRKFDEHVFDLAIVAETHAGHGLAAARDAVPGVSATFDHQPLFAFGVAARSEALFGWLGELGRAITARPFTCEWLTWIDEIGGKLVQVSGSIPPQLRGINGFSVVVDEIAVEPTRVRGDILVVGDHAYDLLGMIDRVAPVFGGNPPAADGKPVPVQLGMFVPWLDSVHVGAKQDRIAIGIGADSERRVVDRIATTAPSRSPFMVFAMDMPRLDKAMKALGKPLNNRTREIGTGVMVLEADDDSITVAMTGTWAH